MERRDFVKLKLESEINPLNIYDDISYAFSNLYLVRNKKTNLYGLIRTDFEEIIPCEYLKNEFLSLIRKKQELRNKNLKNLNISKQDGMTGYVDKNDTLIIERNYQKGLDFSEGLAAVKEDTTWGFIDETGEYQIPSIYEGAGLFQNGLAPVQKDSKWGFINKRGEVIIPLIYDNATPFCSDYALVKQDDQYYFINSLGVKLTIKVSEDRYLELSEIKELNDSTTIIDCLEYLSIITVDNKEIIIQDNTYHEYINNLLNTEKMLLEDTLSQVEHSKKLIKNRSNI